MPTRKQPPGAGGDEPPEPPGDGALRPVAPGSKFDLNSLLASSPLGNAAAGAADGASAADPATKARPRPPVKRAPAKKQPAAEPTGAAEPESQEPLRAGHAESTSFMQERQEASAGVPARYDDGVDWLAAGFRRHRIASYLGVVFGWTGFWLSLWGAVIGCFVGILVALGVVSSTSVTSHLFNMGAGQSITFVSVIVGGLFGIAGGFLVVIKFLFIDHPLQAVIAVLSGLVVTIFIVVVTACFERLSLRLRGYRRLSRDEVRQLAPLVKSVAEAMDLPALPRFAMHDVVIPNAWTHMRTIVITKGLLQSLDDGEISAILAHELHHWQSGDSVGLHFVWAAAFPAVLMFNAGTWLAGSWPDVGGGKIGKAFRTVLGFLGWFIAWPSWVLIKLVLVPVVSASQRGYEFEADQAAARIGLGSQLISALRKLSAFEQGRTGWEAALAATHPPSELRVEALQQPRPDDWEYQEDEFGPPSWSEVKRIFRGLGQVARSPGQQGGYSSRE